MHDKEDKIIAAITKDGFLMCGRGVAKEFGIMSAIMLSELCSRYQHHRNEGTLVKRDDKYWFYYDIETATQRTGMSRDEQTTCMKRLQDAGLVSRKVFGIPPKRYFNINIDKLEQVVSDIEQKYTKDVSVLKPTISWKANLKKTALRRLKSASSSESDTSGEPKSGNPNFRKADVRISGNPILYHIRRDKERYKENTPLPPTPSCNSTCSSDGAPPPTPCVRVSKSSSSSQKEKPALTQHGSHVRLKSCDYDTLCAAHTKCAIDRLIDEMNDYCCASKPGGYKCYAAALRQWSRRRGEASAKATAQASKKPVITTNTRPSAINPYETAEQRIAMGGKRIRPVVYNLLQRQGKDMRGYIADENAE